MCCRPVVGETGVLHRPWRWPLPDQCPVELDAHLGARRGALLEEERDAFGGAAIAHHARPGEIMRPVPGPGLTAVYNPRNQRVCRAILEMAWKLTPYALAIEESEAPAKRRCLTSARWASVSLLR